MLKCPKCSAGSGVTKSRPTKDSVRRRRLCNNCGYRWTTWEIPADIAAIHATFGRQAEALKRRLRALESELVKRSKLLEAAISTTKARTRGRVHRRRLVYRSTDWTWDADKVALMRELYPIHGAPMLAERWGKTITAVRAKANKLGLRKGVTNGHAEGKRLPASAGSEVRESDRAPVGSAADRLPRAMDIQPEGGSSFVLSPRADNGD